MLILLGLFFVIVSLIAWLAKIEDKKRMERRLGRSVADHELTSITAWMKAPQVEEPTPVAHCAHWKAAIGIADSFCAQCGRPLSSVQTKFETARGQREDQASNHETAARDEDFNLSGRGMDADIEHAL